MSKKKNVIARVGNFEITKDSGPEHDYLRIKAIGGHWGISHRDDSPMYGVWMMMCQEPNYAKGMEVIIAMSYTLTNSLLDEGFMRDFFAACEAMNKRRIEAAPKPTDQDEADAIAEIEMLEEAKSQITD